MGSDFLSRIAASPNLQFALMAVAALAMIGAILQAIRSMYHRKPDRVERRRRQMLHREGRLGDGFITNVEGSVIYYTYSVHGVQYETSQDLTALPDRLPVDADRLIGVTNLKYSVNNPGNSILVCEEWSGLRVPQPTGTPGPRREN